MARALLASVIGLLIAGPAFAQPKKAGTPKGAPAPAPTKPADPATPATPAGDGKAVDLPEDPPPVDPSGMQENPDAPKGAGTELGVGTVAPPPQPAFPTFSGYPIEEVQRPITLPALMSEAGFDIRNRFNKYDGNTTLRGRFGVTRQIQIGLEYNVGGFYDDGSGSVKFNTGKSIGLDVTYLVFNWLGARIALPFYLSPFAMGVTLGPSMKFHIGNKFAFGGFGDFLTFKISKFVPSTTDEFSNEGNAMLVDSGSKVSRGALRFSMFATYQWKRNIAVGGDLGVIYDDFKDVNVPYSLRGRIQYSMGRRLDFGGALGLGDLSDARHSVQLNLYAQLRI